MQVKIFEKINTSRIIENPHTPLVESICVWFTKLICLNCRFNKSSSGIFPDSSGRMSSMNTAGKFCFKVNTYCARTT